MPAVIGVWLALSGAVAFLPWLGSASRRQRLREGGRKAWATVVPAVPGAGDASPLPQLRVCVQFRLDDGRVVGLPCARPGRRSSALIPGEKVLVWYDPADPGDVLVSGSRDGRRSDAVFVLAGVVLLTVGLAVATSP